MSDIVARYCPECSRCMPSTWLRCARCHAELDERLELLSWREYDVDRAVQP